MGRRQARARQRYGYRVRKLYDLARWLRLRFLSRSRDERQQSEIFQQGASAGPFPEPASGAYPSAITADTITFYGIIKKHQ
jgi:hypothetical protein